MFDITKFENFTDFIKYAEDVKNLEVMLGYEFSKEIQFLSGLYLEEEDALIRLKENIDRKIMLSRIPDGFFEPVGRKEKQEAMERIQKSKELEEQILNIRDYRGYIIELNKEDNKENYTDFIEYYAQIRYESSCIDQVFELMRLKSENYMQFSELAQHNFESIKGLVLSGELTIEPKEPQGLDLRIFDSLLEIIGKFDPLLKFTKYQNNPKLYLI